jgi:hypothetical protein
MKYEQGTEICNMQNRDVGLFFWIFCEGLICWTRQVVFNICRGTTLSKNMKCT